MNRGRYILKIVKIHLIISCFCTLVPIYALSQNTKAVLKRICIDAGHGGHDPGCHGAYSNEKTITLTVALKLKELIQKEMKGVDVVLTRDRDVFYTLEERGQIANATKSDLFISIHVNSTPKRIGTSVGTETYVLGLTRDKDKKGAITEKSEFEGGEDASQLMNDADPMTQIIIAQYQQAYLKTSIVLGEKIESEFYNQGRQSKGVKQKSLGVLAHSGMPGVLVEIGFLNNPEEEAYLNSEAGITEVATAILNGLKKYRIEYEKTF